VKRKLSVRVRDRADDGEAGVFVEEVVADNEGEAAAFLFVAGLRAGLKAAEQRQNFSPR
jgi:hypothetical protein